MDRVIPVAAIRLHFIQAQLSSEDPTLFGSFATVSTETYIGLSVGCLLTAFLKSFVAVYEDDIGITYTYRGPWKSELKGTSQSSFRSRTAAPKETPSRNPLGRLRTEQGIKGWEREDDPIIELSEGIQGLQIMRTVQLSVRDEFIELPERSETTGI